MCRMIAAVGRFDVSALMDGLLEMSLNRNSAYDHELRSKGSALLHDCGWGAAHRSGGVLTRVRSAAPCFEDRSFGELAGLETDVLILHARRTKERDTICVENSHPFLAEYRGHEWAFCHNGEVKDTSQLTHDPKLVPEGSIDSEPYFFHVLTKLDPDDLTASVQRTVAGLDGFTALNCFLMRAGSIVVAARRDPATPRPRYYTLWRVRGGGFDIVSSEIIAGVDGEWEPLEDGSVTTLTPGRDRP